jgi:hypothetical protein
MTPRPRRRTLLIGAFAALVVAGCKPQRGPTAPPLEATAVGQGERFEAGLPVYDEYFDTIHELHGLVVGAELQERDALATLATMLNLLPTAPADQILRKLRERVPDLPAMEMAIEEGGERKAPSSKVTLASKGWPKNDVKSMMMVLEATATANLGIASRMHDVPERAHRMHSLGQELVGTADKDFAQEPPERRARIKQELQASFDVLVLMANRSRDVHQRTEQFVRDMRQAMTSSGTRAD